MNQTVEYHPLTPERWQEFVTLFGERGACGGCWCMWWHLPRSQFNQQKGSRNREAMKARVKSGPVPGVLAYNNGDPIGWCSLGPRESYSALARSRILKPVDDISVWSITCFFVAKQFRKQGVSLGLIGAAVDYAREQGATTIEGYPVEPKKGLSPDAFVWTGLASAFQKAGFTEVLRRSETRPIMRFYIGLSIK